MLPQNLSTLATGAQSVAANLGATISPSVIGYLFIAAIAFASLLLIKAVLADTGSRRPVTYTNLPMSPATATRLASIHLTGREAETNGVVFATR